MLPIIYAKNISKTYHMGAYDVEAVKTTDFIVGKGEIVVIIGKSGSGKSSLLNVIGGIDKPNTGEVYVNERSLYSGSEEIRTKIRSEEIGFIFQNFNLINEMNMMDNIRLPFYISGKKIDEAYENEIIKMLDLEDRRKFYPEQLSGGERQRIAIARGLSMKPAIILADEPTGNIDTEAGKALMDFVEATNKLMGQTYVIVTHDLEWIPRAHRVFKMKDGYIVEEEKSHEEV